MSAKGRGAAAARALKELKSCSSSSQDELSKKIETLSFSSEERDPIFAEPQNDPSFYTETLSANCIRIHTQTEGVYRYSLSFEPHVEENAHKFRLLCQHKDEFGDAKVFDGNTIYLMKNLGQKVTFQCESLIEAGEKIQLTLNLLKLTKFSDAIHFMNVIIRRLFRVLCMKQVGTNYYSPELEITLPVYNIQIWPGYVSTVKNTSSGIVLLMDVSHKLIRTDSILDCMAQMYLQDSKSLKENLQQALIGQVVITRYNNKTYRIDDLDWDSSPLSTFSMSSGEEITYADYYKKVYNLDIKDRNQPLLVHVPKEKVEFKKGTGLSSFTKAPVVEKKQPELIKLVPELCFMTGLSEDMTKDYKTMKDLSSYIFADPSARYQSLMTFLQKIRNTPEAMKELEIWGMRLEENPMKLKAGLIPNERIITQKSESDAGITRTGFGGIQADPIKGWGNSLLKCKYLCSVDLNEWLVVYPMRSKEDVHRFISQLCSHSSEVSFRVKKPKMLEIPNDKTESYLSSVRSSLTPNTQMVMFVCPTQREDRYAAIKRLVCCESPVPSQVMLTKTMSNSKKFASVVQRVAMQMNSKLGGELWTVNVPLKNVMVVGIDVFHGGLNAGMPSGSRGGGPAHGVSAIGFVFSINSNLSRYYSRVIFQNAGQEITGSLKIAFASAFEEYHKVNHCFPSKVVVFRDGVGTGMMKAMIMLEVNQLKEFLKQQSSVFSPNPNGESIDLIYVIVKKRINMRFFLMDESSSSSNSSVPRVYNPIPGTLVDHSVLSESLPSFFLISQHYAQGTVKPICLVVAYNDSSLSLSKIQRLAYKCTFLYYNVTTTVKVPAPCLYAHRAAKLVGQSLRKEASLELCNKLYYL